MLRFVGKIRPWAHYKAMFPVALTAFSTYRIVRMRGCFISGATVSGDAGDCVRLLEPGNGRFNGTVNIGRGRRHPRFGTDCHHDDCRIGRTADRIRRYYLGGGTIIGHVSHGGQRFQRYLRNGHHCTHRRRSDGV